ncbi:hypothetical protein FA10DRAFT_266983 [Acaromyces ingoldii]|uniref:Nucleoporin Nup133/Nup155-like C-terminal domain-containing protein n=1 Tax=Acaromyces ingoldii TaxID=215250 RepID=A0A316YNZ6_9BASI|nr:hypothetical protein FA10DRAFT_266983 [Acaromyces ingoldii]PWN90524.1 hypothetical protein FA10DRAFT_266983 [Acaromyces ingoldii]
MAVSLTSMGGGAKWNQAPALEEGAILAKDDVSAISVFSRLPLEVAASLQHTDPYSHFSRAELDTQTGFAHLVTHDKCFVWSFVSRGFDYPTCYSFTIPSSSSNSTSSSSTSITPVGAAFSALVPRSSDREPGLILVSAAGDFRFWESVASLTAAADRANQLSVPLGSGETVTALRRCQTTSYVIATSHSRLFHVHLSAQQGRMQPHVSAFAQPRGIFGRLFGAAASFASSEGGIVALDSCSSQDGFAHVFAAGKNLLQKWSLVEGPAEKLVIEQDIRPLIANAVSEGGAATVDWAKIECRDVAATKEGDVAILYSLRSPSSSDDSHGLGIARVSVPSSASSFVVERAYPLHHRYLPQSSSLVAGPRLALPNGGSVAFVLLPDAIITRVLDDNDSLFEDSIGLKDAPGVRIVGFGIEGPEIEAATGIAAMSLMTPSTGTLLLELDPEAVSTISASLASPSERSVVQTARLRAKVEQAVFHGDDARNPIAFKLDPETKGDLIAATEQLSSEIVLASLESLDSIVDIKSQLATRLYRLQALIKFVGENGALGKLSHTCRRRLCSDAELVAAAVELWQYQNDLLRDSTRQLRTMNPLAKSIEAVMGRLGGLGEDAVRLFLRNALSYLNDVFGQLLVEVRASASSGLETQSSVIEEANRAVLAAFDAALLYRSENANLYRLEGEQTALETWTCQPIDVELASSLYEWTEKLIKERTRRLGNDIDAALREFVVDVDDPVSVQQRQQRELKGQLCELASVGLSIYQERLGYLTAASAAGNASFDRERSAFETAFHQARSSMILPLVSIGRQERAFNLAEKHRDFRTLTELCNLPEAFSQTRINHYLHKYRHAFAFELYRWYLEKNKARMLLEQDETFGDLLLDFLDATHHPRVSWLHDLALSRYQSASKTLLEEADGETRLGSKKLMLSLGKLAYVAELDEDQIATKKQQQQIEVIDDQLDLANVHARLKELFVGVAKENRLSGGGGEQDVAESVSELLAPTLGPAYSLVFAGLARKLMADLVLSSEDLIDLLTLKQPAHSSSGGEAEDETEGVAMDFTDYTTSLEVYIRSKDVPPQRLEKASLPSLWRRVILHDDWAEVLDTAGASDEEVNARIESSALFAVVRAALAAQQDGGGEGTIADLVPDSVEACLQAPDLELLQARFAGEATERIEELHAEIETEVETLREMARTARLDRWWEEILRLAQVSVDVETAADADTVESPTAPPSMHDNDLGEVTEEDMDM